MIRAVVREHNKIVTCGGRAEQPKTIEAYRRIRGKANYDSTASNDLSKIMASDGPNKYFAKITKAISKETNRRINIKEAENHLQTKFNQWGWSKGGAARFIIRMQEILNKVISNTIRIHCLKMILYQESRSFTKNRLKQKEGKEYNGQDPKCASYRTRTPSLVKDG